MNFQIHMPGKFIEAKDEVVASAGAEGWFHLTALMGGKPVRSRSFVVPRRLRNMILDSGLDLLGNTSASSGIRYFHVGTGTTVPDPSQVALTNRVGNPFSWTDTRKEAAGAPSYYTSTFFTGTSPIGAFGTVNLTEIGIGGTVVQNKLFSRALIVDAGGNPVAFPITSDEQLQVTYELRVYPPLTDSVFEVDISGVRTATVRALDVNNAGAWGVPNGNQVPGEAVAYSPWYSGGLSAITANTPTGGTVGSGSPTISQGAYSPGSYERSARWDWSAVQAVGVLRTQIVQCWMATYQVEYDPPIAKSNAQSLFVRNKFSWARR